MSFSFVCVIRDCCNWLLNGLCHAGVLLALIGTFYSVVINGTEWLSHHFLLESQIESKISDSFISKLH